MMLKHVGRGFRPSIHQTQGFPMFHIFSTSAASHERDAERLNSRIETLQAQLALLQRQLEELLGQRIAGHRVVGASRPPRARDLLWYEAMV
jgi:hypothetical protein